MAYKTRKQVRDLLKARIDTVKDDFLVYTNKFLKGKTTKSIVIESGGSVNTINSEDMRSNAYKYNIYVLDRIENFTDADTGTEFDDGLDAVQDSVDIKMQQVLDSIHGLCYFINENSNPIQDFTDGNNRLVGLVTEVRAENR